MKKILCLPAAFSLLLVAVHAQQIKIDSLLTELAKAKEDTNKVILYRMLTGSVLNSDPEKAIAFGKAGVQLGKQLGYDKGVAGCYLNLAAAFSSAAKLDSGLLYVDTTIIWSKKVGDPNRLALAFLNRADIQMQFRNLKQSLIDCDTALHYAELANNNDRRARILQTIGSVYFLQDKFAESLDYYERARVLFKEANNKRMLAIILNNIGNVYKNKKEYTAAVENFEQAIELALGIKDQVNLSMYYGNKSDAYTRAAQYHKAAESATKAMEYATQLNNDVQKGIAFNYFGQIYLKQAKYTQSIQAASQAFDIFQNEGLLEEQHTAAEMLAEAYELQGNHANAYKYLLKSKQLGDSLSRQKYDEEMASMQTAFKVEEKNNEIALLNKDRQLQEQQLFRQRIIIMGALALVALAIAGIFLIRSRQRLRQQMKEMELRNSIAADLHDEVGSSLSSIHMLSEMASSGKNSTAAQQEMLHKVTSYSKETMDRMGDIVWMIKPKTEDGQDLQERMQRFLFEMCNSRNINGSFEGDALLQVKLNMPQKKALYLIFKEAVNNALKYADPGNIDVQISKKDHSVELLVSDDGIGFDPENIARGSGLNNMQNRARELGGDTVISSVPGAGTKVLAHIPV